MSRNFTSLAAVFFLAVVGSVCGMAEAVQLDTLYLSGDWQTGPINSETPYTALTSDYTAANKIYAARTSADGGIEQRTWSGTSWVPAVWHEDLTFTELSHSSVGNHIYGLADDGTPYQMWGSASSQRRPTSTRQYVDITGSSLHNNDMYGAIDGGGVAQMYWTGSSWNDSRTMSTGIDYSEVVADGALNNEFYGLHGGGVHQYYWNPGAGAWGYNVASTQPFTTIINDSVLPHEFLGALPAGGVQQAYYWGGWKANPVFATGTVYSELAHDGTNQHNYYGVRADGLGVDRFYYSGGWQVEAGISPTDYALLVGDESQGFRLYGYTTAGPGGVNVAPGKPVVSDTIGYYSAGTEAFPFDNLTDGRLNDTGGPGDWSFWLAPRNATGELVLDLGTVYNINRIAMQNTHNRQYNNAGLNEFRVEISTDNLNWTPLLDDTLAFSNASSIPWQSFSFDRVDARYLKLIVDSYHGNYAGLNEIRVYAIPEPASFILLGSGVLGLWMLRRRRK